MVYIEVKPQSQSEHTSNFQARESSNTRKGKKGRKQASKKERKISKMYLHVAGHIKANRALNSTRLLLKSGIETSGALCLQSGSGKSNYTYMNQTKHGKTRTGDWTRQMRELYPYERALPFIIDKI